jgi:hypothetical protein
VTLLRDDTGRGTEGVAMATFKVLKDARESRSIQFIGDAEFIVTKLMGKREVWRSKSGMRPGPDTVCEWVRDA